ncbi:MAG: lipid A phosphate methyltransferase [Flavobacteriales bacterium]|nr:lipid A phosphate methyltransferase [Flavobacteriales bacterium]|tara:strand:- start:79 stop:816 length:738 start_codon:yes stop_codon:yes gene_type:complete
MALINEIEKQGNFLFKYRGQFPIVLFILAIPFIYFTDFICLELENNFTLASIVLSSIGFVIRAYTIGTTPRGTSGRNTKEQVAEVLNSTGIYSVVRHPLYLGNYFMWIGIVFFTFNWYFIIIVSLLYYLYYERIMFAEERFLERKFGQDYLDWASNLPAFVPNLSQFKKSHISFSIISVMRREYSGVLATVIGFLFVEFIRNFFQQKDILISKTGWYILAITVALSFTLRTFKRRTSILDEKDRS